MTTQEPSIREQTPGEEHPSFKSSEPMEEASFSNLLDILKRRLWWIVGVMAVFLILGVLYAMQQKPVYTAQALATLDVDKVNNPTLENMQTYLPGGVEGEVRLQTELSVLERDNLALNVIDKLHLENRIDFQPLAKPGDTHAQDHLLAVWHNLLKVRIVPKTKLIEVSFTSRDPQTAADVPNALLSAYVVESERARLQMSEDSTRFLSIQLKDAKQRAEEAERNLAEYQKSQGIILIPGQGGGQIAILNRVDDLNRAYTSAQVTRIEKEARYRDTQSKNPAELAELAPSSLLGTLRTQQAVLAAELAETTSKFGPEYPRVKQLRSAEQQINQSIQAEVQRTLNQTREEYVSADRAEENLKSQLDQAKAEAFKTSESSSQLQIRQQEVSNARQLYDNLMRHLNEAEVVAGLQAANIQVVDHARVPTSPSSTPKRSYVLGFLAGGLFLGIASALVLNAFADRITTSAEAREATGIPVLGGIPAVQGKTGSADVRDNPSQVTLRLPRSRGAEAFHSLRTSLLLSQFKISPQVIAVTSSTLGEGKSFTSLNLAIVLAQRGARVLLIDADMRRGTQHEKAGVARDPGLSDLLVGTSDLQSVIQPFNADIPLSILAAGPPPPQPANLLDSPAFSDLLRSCRKSYDFVVIDTPPSVLVSDSMIVGRVSDGVLLVVRSGITERRALARTGQLLAPIQHKVLGLLLNDDPELSRNYGRAASYYTYYEEAK